MQAVSPGLYALLHNIIDYAGLFPPANLPLDEAIHNFIRYREAPEHWMLSRFIIPAVKLDELSQILPKLTWWGAFFKSCTWVLICLSVIMKNRP